MRRLLCGGMIVLGLVAVSGCRHVAPSPSGSRSGHHTNSDDAQKKREIFANAVALLHGLLKDERNVGKLLYIKFESDELDRLITAIAKEAARADDLLLDMAKADPTLRLEDVFLPVGERATRDAIAKTQRGRLLGASGPELQFLLLLTQAQALDYGSHLAQVAGENSTDPERVRDFEIMRARFGEMRKDVLDLLRRSAP